MKTESTTIGACIPHVGQNVSSLLCLWHNVSGKHGMYWNICPLRYHQNVPCMHMFGTYLVQMEMIISIVMCPYEHDNYRRYSNSLHRWDKKVIGIIGWSLYEPENAHNTVVFFTLVAKPQQTFLVHQRNFAPGFGPDWRNLCDANGTSEKPYAAFDPYLKISLECIWHVEAEAKMAANSLTTFSNEFSWMKIYEFLDQNFHWGLFPRVQLTICQHWFRWWLGADKVTNHYLDQWWLVYWRIYIYRPHWRIHISTSIR